MSRALKRMLEEKNEPNKQKPAVEEESEDEDDAPSGFVNPFDLLNQGGGNDDDEDSEDEDPKPVQPAKPKQPAAKNNNKKKKKKGKADQPQKTEEKEEDIDQLVKELGLENTRSELEQAEQDGLVENLLSLQAIHLDADAEMRKLFGPGVIPKEKRDPRIKRVAHRKALIIKPREFWPRMSSGLSMDLIDSKSGVNYFKINWSKEYKEVQKQFIACVNTGDPNTLGQLLHVHPYHIDTLLQLAEAFKFMGELDSSLDLIDRALYAFECSWHNLFNPITNNNQRLEYKHPENRSFFLAMFKHIQDLGRRGCSRTALEFCKLMLKLDPSDPLGVLYLIDTYAIRARQYDFLIELTYSKMFQDRSLSYLPNFAMHVALAKFYLEKEGEEGNTNNASNKKNLRVSSSKLLSSAELLQNALMLFPMLLPPMLKKMSINSLMHREADGTSSDVMQHGYFTSPPFVPPAVQYLSALFVERNAALWRDPDVVTWLKENAIKTKVRAESQDPMVENCAVILREEHDTVEPNVYRHLLLTDDNEVVNSLPADVVNEGFRIYDDEEEKEYRVQDNNQRGNTTVNAIGALLSSILPWNTRPTGEWLSELLNHINAGNAEGGDNADNTNEDVSLTLKKNSDGKSVMTVALKTKKWSLVAETEDSFQRWQDAVKTVVTKAGGKVAAAKLKPEDIVIERTDFPAKRDSRADSLGSPHSNPSTPRAAREEQPQHQSGEFSVSGGEPSSTDSQDRPPVPTRSPSVQQLGGPSRPHIKKPPLPPRPGESKSPSLPPRPDENGSGNTSDASGASSPAQTDSPAPTSPPDPAHRKMFRAPSQSVVLNNSGGAPVPTPPSRGPGKGPMPGRGKFGPGPGGPPGMAKEGNPMPPPRGPNGVSSPPPLSPKKSNNAIAVGPSPVVDAPQPEQPTQQIPSPRERAPTMLGEKEAHRAKIAREILETERGYFKSINSLITFYLGPLTSQATLMNVPIESIKTLFPTNLELIIQFNKELLAQLEERINNFTPVTTIGDVFMKLSPFLKMYNEYSSAYQTALNMYNQLRKDNPLFVKELETCRKSSGSQLTLEDLIIMPVQRIPRYKLLLEDFLKNTDKAHVDYANLQAALSKVNEVAAFINESVRKSDNAKKMMGMTSKGANFDNLIAPHRFLIRDGSNKVTEHKRKEMKHFFLFNDLFVHVKESLLKDGHDLSNPEFVWPLNLVWISEALLPKKVEIIGPNGSMTLNVKNDQSWVKDLKTHCQNLLNLLNENDPSANNNNSHRKGKYTYPGGSTYDGDWIDGRRQGLGTFSQCGNIYTGEWVSDKRSGKGKLIFANGYEYDGTWKDDMPNGKGVMLTPDNGAKYEGDWKDGKRHGIGHLVFPNGDVYDGEFSDDGISGRGKLICSSGMVYEGEFKDDLFHGVGKLTLPSKTSQLVYEGSFKQGLKHGRGVLRYPHGAVYEGEWQEDMRHGKGVMKEKDNSSYEGDWANDMYDGQGAKIYPNGSRYNGHWSRGVKKGQGQFIYSNGTRYDGNWADDMRQGIGGFVDCDGSTYQGEWVADRREGKGVMTYSSGARYDGYWHFDKFHKTGTFTGGAEDLISKYEGEWQNGRMHGKGTLHFTNGDVFKGSFKDNKFHGQAVYNYANGSALNAKWNYGVKEGKTSFTTQDKETFSGSIKEPLSNVIEEKGDLMHIAPTFPLMPIYFDTETGRTSLSRN